MGELVLINKIDISNLFKDKKVKAFEVANLLFQLQHENLLNFTARPVINAENTLLTIRINAPDHITNWKSFCKRKFTDKEILIIFRHICQGLTYLHSQGVIHRDVHPTRIHCSEGIVKFNMIGMPYNYKKLLKKESFCGHVNYSAPELLEEGNPFTPNVDIWSLGCCLFYLCSK